MWFSSNDSQSLKLINVSLGGFVGGKPPQYLNESNVYEGVFLGPVIEKDLIIIGGSLIGGVDGKSGGGELAILTFGYYTVNYEAPEIIIKEGIHETRLLDSNGMEISINENVLSLTFP
ncbi:hypothetical protein DRO69_09020 [Candidatus Bathyarchaeota archaeon]|nr:MAG: hypothetical protein DRO69_09020 [Candidatus Bathyarchaeota archaeon]